MKQHWTTRTLGNQSSSHCTGAADFTSTNWSAMRMCSASMRISSGVAMATKATALSLPKCLYAHDLILRINFTAAMPLLATSTLHTRAHSERSLLDEVVLGR